MQPFSSRLQLVQNHLSGPKKPAGPRQAKPVLSSLDWCFFDDLLTPEETSFRKEVRAFAEKEVAPIINEYIEKAEFPEILYQKIGQTGWVGKFLKAPYGEDKNAMMFGLLALELSRVDASVGTAMIVHSGLSMFTLDSFCSDEQKKKYFEDFKTMKLTSGWGLTEPDIGSDASNLTTRVKKTDKGYVLNGAKRWIGNANKHMVIAWARNEDTNKIEAFMVPINTPGVKVEVIKRKLALRSVQNCHITFTDAVVSEDLRLPKADKSFESVNHVLEHSRIFVAWIAVGIALGVYDNAIKYADSRKQFGKSISSFQLQQEKISRMMGHIQSMLLLVWRVTRLYEAGKLTIGRAAMAKAWCTRTCREVAGLGREIMGGNGIIIDNYAIKAVTDIEAIYTYEGTYDINSLVTARELTGVAAFKGGR